MDAATLIAEFEKLAGCGVAEDCQGEQLSAASRSISIELEECVFARLDEFDVSSGEGVFAVVVNGGRLEEIGVIEDVTALAGGEIGDGDGVGVLCAVDASVAVVEVALALLLGAVLMSG